MLNLVLCVLQFSKDFEMEQEMKKNSLINCKLRLISFLQVDSNLNFQVLCFDVMGVSRVLKYLEHL